MKIIGRIQEVYRAQVTCLTLRSALIVGAASFGKIVTSLTESVIMPVIGWAH